MLDLPRDELGKDELAGDAAPVREEMQAVEIAGAIQSASAATATVIGFLRRASGDR